MSKHLEGKEEEILALIKSGEAFYAIAGHFGVDRGDFTRWIEADSQRSARAREARKAASAAWDEKAERGIDEARDPFELAKAKELAHHYRWRASKIAPKEYGDKVQTEVTGADGGPLQVTVNYVKPKVSE